MITVPIYCLRCTHFTGPLPRDKVACKAYLRGIPKKIVTGEIRHTEIRAGQEGDYVFEEIPA